MLRRRFLGTRDPRALTGIAMEFDMEAEWRTAGLTPAQTTTLQTVTDQLANGYDYTQGTAAARATLRHDGVRPCLTPDGIDDQYTMTTGAHVSYYRNQSKVWIIVAARHPTGAAGVVVNWPPGASVNPGLRLSCDSLGGRSLNVRRVAADSTSSDGQGDNRAGIGINAVAVDFTAGVLSHMGALSGLVWSDQYTATTVGVTDDVDGTRARLFATMAASPGSFFSGDLFYLAAGRGSLPTKNEFFAAMRFIAYRHRLPVTL